MGIKNQFQLRSGSILSESYLYDYKLTSVASSVFWQSQPGDPLRSLYNLLRPLNITQGPHLTLVSKQEHVQSEIGQHRFSTVSGDNNDNNNFICISPVQNSHRVLYRTT